MRGCQKSPGNGPGGSGECSQGGADSLTRRPAGQQESARRWFVSGRVQGVGFRSFVEEHARSIGLTGWVRNLDDGRVEAFAAGTPVQLDQLAARLYQGPPHSTVRGVEQLEAEMQQLSSFHTK